MSVVNQIKGFVMINLDTKVPKEIKDKLNKLFVELDSDLDIGGYDPSESVVESIEEFDQALINLGTEDDSVITKPNKEEAPDISREELLEGVGTDDSDNEEEDDK